MMEVVLTHYLHTVMRSRPTQTTEYHYQLLMLDHVRLPAKETACLLSSVPVSYYLHGRRSLEVSLGRIQVQEEPVDSRGVGIQAEAAAAGDPGEDPAPSWAGMAPSAMVFPSTHSSVRHCTSSGGWRGSTRTGAASGAASVAAAAAGGVAHVDWRTSSRPARPRNRRSSVPGRRRTICGA